MTYEELIGRLGAIARGAFVNVEVFPPGTDMNDAAQVGAGTIVSFAEQFDHISPSEDGYRLWWTLRGRGPNTLTLKRAEFVDAQLLDWPDEPAVYVLIHTTHAAVRLFLWR